MVSRRLLAEFRSNKVWDEDLSSVSGLGESRLLNSRSEDPGCLGGATEIGSPKKCLKRTPPSVTPPAGETGRRRATLRLRRLATPLSCSDLAER
jgi:hypothetical protein